MTPITFSLKPDDLLREAGIALAGLLMFVSVVLVAQSCSGCKPAQTPAELEAAYTAELVACAATQPTKALVAACKESVNRKYGLCDNPAEWPRIQPCKVSQ